MNSLAGASIAHLVKDEGGRMKDEMEDRIQKAILEERKRCATIAAHYFDDFTNLRTMTGRIMNAFGVDISERIKNPAPLKMIRAKRKRKSANRKAVTE
jgi:hypothetical protein